MTPSFSSAVVAPASSAIVALGPTAFNAPSIVVNVPTAVCKDENSVVGASNPSERMLS